MHKVYRDLYNFTHDWESVLIMKNAEKLPPPLVRINSEDPFEDPFENEYLMYIYRYPTWEYWERYRGELIDVGPAVGLDGRPWPLSDEQVSTGWYRLRWENGAHDIVFEDEITPFPYFE